MIKRGTEDIWERLRARSWFRHSFFFFTGEVEQPYGNSLAGFAAGGEGEELRKERRAHCSLSIQ